MTYQCLGIQSWVGPGGHGRTVAAIGVDNALLGQLSAASTRPDLSWKIGSTQVSRIESNVKNRIDGDE